MNRSISYLLAGVLSVAFLAGCGDTDKRSQTDKRGEEPAAKSESAALVPEPCPPMPGATATIPASAEPAFTPNPIPEKVYCRKFPASAPIGTERLSWQLFPLSESDIASLPDADFVIVKDFKPDPTNKGVTIERCDHIQIDKVQIDTDRSVYTLMHYDRDGLLKASVANLSLDEDDGVTLWAKGSVNNRFNAPVGTYYVYRTKDHEPCDHPKPYGDGVICRRFHFEYFSMDHLPGERPNVGVNVNEVSAESCSGPRETDEGDGDEGRRPR